MSPATPIELFGTPNGANLFNAVAGKWPKVAVERCLLEWK
jgi:hypothetical protein